MIVKEFLAALGDGRTYNPRSNAYMIFGVLWGLPVPLVTMGLDLYLQRQAPTLQNAFGVLANHPFQMIFLLHPILFGVLFGAMGTVRDRHVQRISTLVGDLQGKLQSLRELNAQLRETDRMKDEFLGTISHELKTPLVTVRGYAEMLSHGRAGQLDERQKHYAQLMLKNVDRQLHLINDLLDYVRIRAHPDEHERQTFDLRDMIYAIAEAFAPSIEKKVLQLEIDMAAEPLIVDAHKRNIEILFNNLFSNAIKFTDVGKVRIEARRGENGRIVTTFRDTGCGIAEEHLPFIFERFRQADGSTRRKHPGTGLGLAIVKKILDNYGCSIEAKSRPGEGTTFRFDLPAARKGAAEAVAKTAGSEGRVTHGGGEQGGSHR